MVGGDDRHLRPPHRSRRFNKGHFSRTIRRTDLLIRYCCEVRRLSLSLYHPFGRDLRRPGVPVETRARTPQASPVGHMYHVSTGLPKKRTLTCKYKLWTEKSKTETAQGTQRLK